MKRFKPETYKSVQAGRIFFKSDPIYNLSRIMEILASGSKQVKTWGGSLALRLTRYLKELKINDGDSVKVELIEDSEHRFIVIKLPSNKEILCIPN